MADSVLDGLLQNGVNARIIHFPKLQPRVEKVLPVRGAPTLSRLAGSMLLPGSVALLLADLVRARPRALLFIKCDTLPALAYRAVKRIVGGPVAAFHPDDPFNFRTLANRHRAPAHRRALDQIREVDDYMIWSHALVERCRAEGAKQVHYFPFACDANLHARQVPGSFDDAEFKADIMFVGAWDETRERWLAKVADAAAARGYDLAIWGPSAWKTHTSNAAVKAAWRGRGLYGDELAKAVCASKISLNFLRAQNVGACNMRTFEIPCAGGFMLHERAADAARMFPPGEACDDFADATELLAKLDHWLAPERDAERQQVRDRAHELSANFSYRAWTRQLLDLWEGRA